jgi:hypothetical protein
MKHSLAAPAFSFLLSLGTLSYALINEKPGAPPPPQDLNFGRDVRPILARHCFKCHGPDASKAAAGLRLDIFDGATKTLPDGAIGVVPGAPARSRVIARVSDPDANLRMPPPGGGPPLTTEETEILKTWIAKGAHYAKHWAFVPPLMPTVPEVKNPAWSKNPVDRFLLSKMQSVGLAPEPEADRDTLALRAAQTLTGLPPTAAELNQFRNDTKPGAYERYVDRLIAKPEYGEHQARYWMDAVRYADTHGLQLDNERSIYPYREWIIRAFNQDLPYDKFVEWQLAGDLVPKPTNDQLIATGYVRSNLTSNEGGAIEEEFLARNTFDRVDTTSTVLLGLTIGCARCHDHKYDPIKQRDYYGLYAYFDSTQDAPLDGNIALPPPFFSAPTPDQEKDIEADKAERARLFASVSLGAAVQWAEANLQPVAKTRDWQASPVYSADSFDHAFDKASPGEPMVAGAVAWKPLPFEVGRPAVNIIGKDNSSIYVRGTITYPRDQTTLLRVSSDDAIKLWLNGRLIHSHKVNRGLNDAFDEVKADFHAGDNELIAKVTNGGGPDGFNLRIGNADQAQINSTWEAYSKAPATSAAKDALLSTYLELGPSGPDAMAYRKLVKDQAALEASLPKTLIAREMPQPRPTFILRRGQYDQKGDPVQRHIPPALCDYAAAPKPSGKQDRLSLARWITSPDNPLVARVFVNRVWQQFFGVGLIKTSEDFGTQGEWPIDQPLLDYLAVRFVRDGWSVKRLNRLIVTSAAFRQSSRVTPSKLTRDPENRYVDRGPRFRLDAEVIRDKALMAAGLLIEQIGGHSFKPYQPDGLWESASDPASGTHDYKRDHDASIYRRSMYLFWKRTSPPPVMTTFDAPLRDTCTVRRSITNTPLQALTTLNETAFLESARAMSDRLLHASSDDSKRLRIACDAALGHPPDRVQAAILLRALNRYRKAYESNPVAARHLIAVGDAPPDKAMPAPAQAAWMIVCSTLMNTDEFLTLH